MRRHTSLSGTLAFCLQLVFPACLSTVVAAQDGGLVIAGEQIAGAETFAAAKKEGKLVMFSAYPADAIKIVVDAFQKDTGIHVDVVRLTTEKLYPRVLAEHAAGKLAADYVDLTDLPLVRQLVDKGVLNRPHKVPSFDRISDPLKDAQGRWYAFYRPPSAIGINAAIVGENDFPKSWMDLLDPKWAGKIGIPSIDVGGSAFTNFTFMREVLDKDFWEKLARQRPRIYPGTAPTVMDMIRGETSMVVMGAPPLVTQVQKGAPIRIVFPAEGIPSFPVSGGMTTTAKNPNAAAVFVNWLTSKRGSEVIGSSGAYGLHPDAVQPRPAGIEFPPAAKVWNITIDLWERLRIPYSREWRTTFGQN